MHSDGMIKFFTKRDVLVHNTADNCWVVVFKKVLDLSPLMQSHPKDPLTAPILASAGSDISHWFEENLSIKTVNSGTSTPPNGVFLCWNTDDQSRAWWKDDSYVVGLLATRTRLIKVLNMLSSQESILEVPVEETLEAIEIRYSAFNKHTQSYTWKYLGRVLNRTKTLSENAIPDDSQECERLGISLTEHILVLHVYYNDDLTVA